MADLTTTAKVKTFIGETGSGEDSRIGTIVSAVSERILSEIRRQIVEAAIIAEKHDGNGRSHVLTLHDYPVATSPAVVVRVLNGSSFEVLAATEYEVDHAAGQVLRVKNGTASAWEPGIRNIEVDYTAGFASVPADLEFAATLQSAYVFTKRGPSAIGARGSILDTGDVTYLTGPWAPGVLGTIDRYRNARAA